MSVMAHPISAKIHQDLVALSNPYRKKKIAEYMKTSSLSFIGVELPEIHSTVNNHIKGLNPNDLPSLMESLWKIETFETRVAAIDVLKVYAKKGAVAVAMAIADRWVDDAEPLEKMANFWELLEATLFCSSLSLSHFENPV